MSFIIKQSPLELWTKTEGLGNSKMDTTSRTDCLTTLSQHNSSSMHKISIIIQNVDDLILTLTIIQMRNRVEIWPPIELSQLNKLGLEQFLVKYYHWLLLKLCRQSVFLSTWTSLVVVPMSGYTNRLLIRK